MAQGYIPNEDDLVTPNEIKTLMKETIQKLNYWTQLSWDKEGSGSIYSEIDGIHKSVFEKISPTQVDYDYLMYPTQVECMIEQCWQDPCYCRVFVINKHELPIDFQMILGPLDELTPSVFKKYIFPVFDKIVKKDRRLKRIKDKSTSPAYTLDFKCDSKQLFNLDWVLSLRVKKLPTFLTKWKSKKLTEEEKMNCPIYVVTKPLTTSYDELDLWRVSFSAVEKKILRDKCTWHERFVLRFLKGAVKEVKKNDNTRKEDDWKICSYHVQTHCLHSFEKMAPPIFKGGDIGEFKDYPVFPQDPLNMEFGTYEELIPGPLQIEYRGNVPPDSSYKKYEKYQQFVYGSFYSALQSQYLPHFFFPDINLLQDVDMEECAELINWLDLQQQESTEMSALWISELFEAKRRKAGLVKRSTWTGLLSEMPNEI